MNFLVLRTWMRCAAAGSWRGSWRGSWQGSWPLFLVGGHGVWQWAVVGQGSHVTAFAWHVRENWAEDYPGFSFALPTSPVAIPF
jgi:hypothetical protein